MFGDNCPARWLLALMLALPMLALPTHAQQPSEPAHAHPEQAQPYACPMHLDQTGQQGDRCPKCKMFLTPVDATYACPMHPEQTGAIGDRCPICNMYLAPEEDEEEVASQEGHNHGAEAGTQPLSSPAVKPNPLQPGSGGVKYVCPMHPHIVSDEPGTCPICGMDLEKVELGTSTEEVVVGVPGGMQQALGMRVESVQQGTLWRYIDTIGTVEYDQDALSHIHARVSGWIEKLGVASVGDQVKQGDLLFELYSPELINAQDDYLLALDSLKSDTIRGPELMRKARLRLELLGMDSRLIQQLERSGKSLYRVPFYAQQDGYISQLNVRDGMYIQPATEVMKLVNLDNVWVIAEVFENQQGWFNEGQDAAVTASALGLFELEGQIDYIYPELDPVTRAMQVRVSLANPEGKLRPGSLVDVELYGTAKRGLTLVPTEALIQTGRSNRVVVQRADTEFVVKEVTLGMIAQGKAEVLSGLEPGERVVVSGQFLLDSEASLKGSLMRMSSGSAHSGHSH
ncbi:efflux RND transporter periplasmic adaptor subunit [Ferrimonas sediminicola]|uniref:Efflux RND transporter periplasmic adaptor subunit n=1 Tax=Ferrimonas sediminicola TaxID=2569538 RepID=A0A4U1BAP6_9GAMM|nr:efflux RND transporter periplasmic adaptor subunit [Ferrimonas sediminicola]TKB47605.1 efflux RND transporter periplasmic adaptor subunit [Ferrimonas sediminicola]